jgi:hypothetical protein
MKSNPKIETTIVVFTSHYLRVLVLFPMNPILKSSASKAI